MAGERHGMCESALMLLLTEGRAGEIWEFSNKQYPACRISGTVGRRSAFTLFCVFYFSVLLVFFLISCSLLSLHHSIFWLSPISLCYCQVCVAQPFGYCTYCQQYCVARLLWVSTNDCFSSLTTLHVHCQRQFWINPLTPELNPSAERCLTRFFSGDLLLEPCISLIYAWKTNKYTNFSFSLLIMYVSSYMFRHYIAIFWERC
jgi:hypothetical protein